MKTQETALAEIKQQYKDCNLLMPVASEVQLNPFYKYTVMEVKADISDNSGDIFKVGSVKVGNEWMDTFSPAKPLLMKLAAAAGIQFDPNNTYGTYLSKNCYKAKAHGALRMPDGSGKTHCDEKVINLEDEEDRFRLEFMDKSIQGIKDNKAAEEAAKLFKGEWFDSEDRYGKPCKAYRIADQDRQKYIDRSVLVNMTLLRKTFAEKAMTGAILRVIRALIGMKGQYTKAELKKPFAVPRYTFNPDFNDPAVRNAMLSQGLSSMSNMFGTYPVLPSAGIREADILDAEHFNPEEFANNAAFTSDRADEPAGGFETPQQEDASPFNNPAPQNGEGDDPGYDNPRCHICDNEISPGVASFSERKYGMPLCMTCQKERGER